MLDRGGFKDAFSRIANVKASRPDQLFDKIALIADAGIALRNIKILEYGLYLLEHNARDTLAVPACAPYHWFNLGNLQVNILSLLEYEGSSRCWYDRPLTVKSREAYKKAANSVVDDNHFKSQILTAHGRLLYGLGRDREAFDLFHKATLLNPDEDEAELGRIESLAAISGTAPALEENLLKEAGGRLISLEKRSESHKWNSNIKELKELISERLGTSDIEEPDYPRNTIDIDSEKGYTMVMYNLKHHLYLSPCAGCLKCDRAIGDAAVIGARHAVFGGKVADRYRRMAILIGRLTERHRALRAALFDHHQKIEVPDGADYQPHIPAVDSWKPIPAATVSLLSILSGLRAVMEGMAACAGLYLDREIKSPLKMNDILGTPTSPNTDLYKLKNPAFHAFWDLWADGEEDLIPGVNLIREFGDNLSSRNAESLSLNHDDLTVQAMSLTEWSGKLIFYLIRIADRDARGDTEDPSAWPLRPFVIPESIL